MNRREFSILATAGILAASSAVAGASSAVAGGSSAVPGVSKSRYKKRNFQTVGTSTTLIVPEVFDSQLTVLNPLYVQNSQSFTSITLNRDSTGEFNGRSTDIFSVAFHSSAIPRSISPIEIVEFSGLFEYEITDGVIRFYMKSGSQQGTVLVGTNKGKTYNTEIIVEPGSHHIEGHFSKDLQTILQYTADGAIVKKEFNDGTVTQGLWSHQSTSIQV